MKKENGSKQRIGHAIGDTPYSFNRYGNGLALDLYKNIYQELESDNYWQDRAMRDPWVMKHPYEINL